MSPLFLLLPLSACTGASDDRSPAGEDTEVADTDTAPADTDTGEAPENHPPSAAALAIVPAAPAAGHDFSVVLVTPAVDPDGDAVTYRYAWTVDGVPAELATELVPGASAADGQVWAVTVTPTDGDTDGEAATATVTVGNVAPSAPGLAFNPAVPADGDTLELVLDPPAADPEGDPITTTITWYKNDSLVPWFADLTVIDAAYVGYDDTFRAVVSVTDGYHDPVVTEASISVLYGCDNLPPFNLGDTTLTDARAYHGLTFADDGTLVGYDGSGALVKSSYDGTREVFVPGVSSIQQLDRLPDGDFVAADNGNSRLMRISPAGGTSTLASDVGYVYGVTVGPDGMVYVTNGGILRVDPDTGESTELIATPSGWTAHVVNFNLDSTVMYIGTIGSGNVYYMDLDANLDPVTAPLLYASGVGSGWHDGIDLDVCGNLYVADYSSRGLYRVETDGTVTSMVRNNPTAYGHGLAFGRGLGGWADDTLYQPQPYGGNTVREVVLGLRSADTVRTWNGVSVPW